MNDQKAKKESSADIGNNYGQNYLQWKSWGNDTFGTLDKSDARYFCSEIKRTKQIFPKQSKVLEIGFGNGSFLTYALNNGWDICGTEANNNLVDLARNLGFNVTSADDLSHFSSNTFDLIVAFDVLEHIPQDFIPEFFKETKRLLKDGGFFIARFPNGDSPFGLINQNGDITHITTIGSGKARFFAAKEHMRLVYIGGEAKPLMGVGALHFLHRVATFPVKALINIFVNAVFFPRSNIDFCSSNLTVIYQADKRTPQNIDNLY